MVTSGVLTLVGVDVLVASSDWREFDDDAGLAPRSSPPEAADATAIDAGTRATPAAIATSRQARCGRAGDRVGPTSVTAGAGVMGSGSVGVSSLESMEGTRPSVGGGLADASSLHRLSPS